jgi:hypothetical protein
MGLLNRPMGPVRLPLVALSEVERHELADAMTKAGLFAQAPVGVEG